MAQPENIHEVTLSAEDVESIWSLFRYDVLSGVEGLVTTTSYSGPIEPNTASGTVDRPGDTLENTHAAPHDVIAPVHDSHSQTDPVTDLSWDVISGMPGQQALDDDWRLFGRPWNDYFP